MFLRGYSSRRMLALSLQRAFVRVRILAHVFQGVFGESIRPWTNTYPMFLRGYSSMDEYLRRVFERVFVRRTNACRRTNTCPMFLRGYSSVDEYLPHKPKTKPTDTNTYTSEGCAILHRRVWGFPRRPIKAAKILTSTNHITAEHSQYLSCVSTP